MQVDSDVERTFVNEHLRPDEKNLVVYFKFPTKFQIGLPRIIGSYNPDLILPRFRGQSDYAANAFTCVLNSNSTGLT